METIEYSDDGTNPAIRCHDHCVSCGQHFVSIGAFDAHRRDGQCATMPLRVFSLSKDGVKTPVLSVKTANGVCRLSDGCYQDGRLVHEVTGITVYELTTTAAQRTERGAPVGRGRRGRRSAA